MIIQKSTPLKTENSNRWWLLLAFGALAFLIYTFRVVLIYLLISVIVGFIGDPIVDRLRRIKFRKRQMSRSAAAVITLTLFLGVFVGVFFLFAPLVAEEVLFFSSIDPDIIVSGVQTRLVTTTAWLDGLGLEVDSAMIYDYAISKTRDLVSMEGVTNVVSDVFSILTSLVTGFFAVLFMSFFFLKDASLFVKIIFRFTPDKYMEMMKTIIVHTHAMLTRYFSGLVLQMFIMTAMVTLGLWAMGVKNALLIGVFAGLANVVPYVGPLFAMAFGLMIGLTSGLAVDPEIILWVWGVKIAGVFLTAQFIDNWVIQPFVLGSSVDTHPLELFILLLAAATVGGILAMAVALPVYIILRIVVKEVWSTVYAS